MQLEVIESFLAVARYRSISRAAASLYITQPTMSQRLQRLEKSLGLALFERAWTGVRLTEQGAYFLPYAAQLMRDLSNAATVLGTRDLRRPRSFAEVADHPREIMFGVDDWLSGKAVRAVLIGALDAYRLDEFRITNRPASTLIDLLELNQLDAGLFYSAGPEEHPFDTETVGTEELVLVHPRGTVLEEFSARALKELLARYRFVLFDNPVLAHRAHITTALIDAYEISRFHVVDDYRTVEALIGLGECITVLPAGVVLDRSGRPGAGLLATRLPGLLPEISVTVGISEVGREHGVTGAFARSVARTLSADGSGDARSPEGDRDGTGTEPDAREG
ncbi:LysR family transcriptional regulator [Kitasatospora sp. NPDC050543]|uniref:LysR family transcriptional regulator n=1 Tax=Kitasatospora sp. NPDC050543 TaxID=3364054 RepID=UPI0037B13A1A